MKAEFFKHRKRDTWFGSFTVDKLHEKQRRRAAQWIESIGEVGQNLETLNAINPLIQNFEVLKVLSLVSL